MLSARGWLVGLGSSNVLAALAACSGDSPVATTPVLPAAVAPTAAFTAPATATALQPVALNASGSSSTDGSALQYVWDFGNGQRGGGVTIAHVFAVAGDDTVTLTVFDGANRTATATKTITVSASAATVTTATAVVAVTAIDGTVLDGVAVSPASAAAAATDASGKVTVNLNAGVPTTLKLSKPGYADQFLNVSLPAGAGNDGYFQVTMRTRDAPLTLADATAGGALTGRDGAAITVPANAFIDASGAAVAGAVQVSITPVDVTQAGAGGFPGGFEGVQADGTTTLIVSLGVNEFVPLVNGQPVQLAPGKSATITIPVYAAQKLDGTLVTVGDVIALWSLDESTGMWIQEGTGTVVASTGSPSGLALNAVVTHLSWWNDDLGYPAYGPQPKCEAQANVGIPGSGDPFASASICNMLADIDHGMGSGSSSGDAQLQATRARARRVHAQTSAASPTPQPPGFARQYVVPINGGQSIAVPAGVDVRLTAFALNGTWTGSTVVHGATGVQDAVVITLHPIAQATGPATEALTLPFDGSRSVAAATTAQYTFTGTAQSLARITLTPVIGTQQFQGLLNLTQGTTAVAATGINLGVPTQTVAYLTTAGTYTLTAQFAGPASYRLQVSLEPSDAQVQPITLPFNGAQTLIPQAAATFSFTGSGSKFAHIVVGVPTGQPGALPTGQVQLLQGSTVIGSATLSGTSTQLLVSLPSDGGYTIQVTGTVGASIQLSADLEGGVQTETLTLPTDITRSIDPGTAYHGSLTLTSAATIWLDSRDVGGDSTRVKLVASDGTVLFSSPSVVSETDTGNSFVATLPPGTYTVQVAALNNLAATERLTLTTTSWAPVAPTLPAAHISQNVGLVMDRNATPVVGYLDSTLVNNSTSYTLKLRRWTGTAWETVGSDIVLGAVLCGVTSGASFAFDSANNPVLMYASVSSTDGSSTFAVQRFSGGAWAAVGANGGKLPFGSTGTDLCGHPTSTLVGADDQPVVAYASDNGTVVMHFDGTSWVGYATPAGDVFGPGGTYFESDFDPSGKLWLIIGQQSAGTVGTALRFNTATLAWEPVGAGFPQIGTIGLAQPRLRFDSSGSPVVAWAADVGANGTSSAGVAVYRFNGSAWVTTGGYEADVNSSGGSAPDPSFVLFNDQAIVSWDNQELGGPLFATVVVQTNTASGWTPIGGGAGQLPQYNESGVSTAEAHTSRLATDGKDVYLSVIALPMSAAQSLANPVLTLLKKTGN